MEVMMEIPIQMDGLSAALRGSDGRCSQFIIEKDEIMRVTVQSRPVRVECLIGTLWVTMENDPRDYILQRGESVLLQGPGQIVIQSLPCGKMCITAE
jgi:hypothetical protein